MGKTLAELLSRGEKKCLRILACWQIFESFQHILEYLYCYICVITDDFSFVLSVLIMSG